jgi:hypothetical protein
MLPLVILSIGSVVCAGVSVYGSLVSWPDSPSALTKIVYLLRVASTVFMVGLLYLCVYLVLPESFILAGVNSDTHNVPEAYLCALFGIFAWLALSFFT